MLFSSSSIHVDTNLIFHHKLISLQISGSFIMPMRQSRLLWPVFWVILSFSQLHPLSISRSFLFCNQSQWSTNPAEIWTFWRSWPAIENSSPLFYFEESLIQVWPSPSLNNYSILKTICQILESSLLPKLKNNISFSKTSKTFLKVYQMFIDASVKNRTSLKNNNLVDIIHKYLIHRPLKGVRLIWESKWNNKWSVQAIHVLKLVFHS